MGLIQGESKLALGAGKLAGDARITLAGGIHSLGKRLEQRLDDVVRFVAVKQLQVKIAAGFIGEGLKKLPGQPKAECAGLVLLPFGLGEVLVGISIQSTPDELRPSAKINHTAREAFIHRHVSFPRERILRVKASAVAAETFLVAERLDKRLPQCNPAILDGVVRVHGEIAVATQFQIYHPMLCKEGQHVIKKGNAGLDGSLARAIEREANGDARLFGVPFNLCLPEFHHPH